VKAVGAKVANGQEIANLYVKPAAKDYRKRARNEQDENRVSVTDDQ